MEALQGGNPPGAPGEFEKVILFGHSKTWHVDPGQTIILPEGSEQMRESWSHSIWYSPHLDRSYYIQGSNLAGWDVTEYAGPLCGRCSERRAQYRERGR